jgi:single-strand DNA-binding protein
MNKVCLIGRLTRKPELRESEGGIKQTTFTLAINRIKEGVDFINCVAWNKQAEVIEKYCDKGRELGVEGRIQVNSYEDKEGNKKHSTVIVVEGLTFIGKKDDTKEEVKEEKKDAFEEFGDELELTDDDLPF